MLWDMAHGRCCNWKSLQYGGRHVASNSQIRPICGYQPVIDCSHTLALSLVTPELKIQILTEQINYTYTGFWEEISAKNDSTILSFLGINFVHLLRISVRCNSLKLRWAHDDFWKVDFTMWIIDELTAQHLTLKEGTPQPTSTWPWETPIYWLEKSHH